MLLVFRHLHPDSRICHHRLRTCEYRLMNSDTGKIQDKSHCLGINTIEKSAKNGYLDVVNCEKNGVLSCFSYLCFDWSHVMFFQLHHNKLEPIKTH